MRVTALVILMLQCLSSLANHQNAAFFNDIQPADDEDFIELLNRDSINHQLRPEGYAFHPRTKLLEYDRDDPANSYPPFTYHGLYGPPKWHEIPWQNLLLLAGRSFMLLRHHCQDDLASRESHSHQSDVEELMSCEADSYHTLPRCDALLQSPVNFDNEKVELDDSLQDYVYANLNQTFDFLMSLPWDGTNLLTVELLGAEKDICDSLAYHQKVSEVDDDLVTKLPYYNQTCSNLSASEIFQNVGIRKAPQIQGGAVTGGTLYLDRFYIKYGTNMTHGSEHTIDGKPFSMELQFIFTKDGRQFINPYWDTLMNYYTSEGAGESVESTFGKNVHIISVFIQVVHDDEYGNVTNIWNDNAVLEIAKLAAAARHFWKVHNRPFKVQSFTGKYQNRTYKHRGFKSGSKLTALNLSRILPPKKLLKGTKNVLVNVKFFTYDGSLTHPPCFEHIDYGVYAYPIFLNQTLWESFLFIPSEFDDTKFVAGNYRTIHSIYHRATDLKTQRDRKKVEAARALIDARRIRKSNRSIVIKKEDYDYYETDSGHRITIVYGSLLMFIFTLTVI